MAHPETPETEKVSFRDGVQNLISRLTFLPRWVIILIDLSVSAASVSLAFLLRFNFNLEDILEFHPLLSLLVVLVTSLIATLITKAYAGIVRYTGIQDAVRIFYTELLSLAFLVLINLLYFYNVGKNLIPYSVILISFFISALILYQYRLIVKSIFSFYKSEVSNKIPVVIFGAGLSGVLAKQAIDSDLAGRYRLVGFIDDDISKNNKVINGTKIYFSDKLQYLVDQYDVREIIISIKDIGFERKNEIVDEALKYHLKIRNVPPVEKWVRGELNLKQIKEINIEDLLGRDVIKLEHNALLDELGQKVICITGGAGSIGAELARQVIQFEPHTLILIDQAESPLYTIERELRDLQLQTRLIIVIADICNELRIERIFKDFSPEIVFHAAAYKHVPMMESNPAEAIAVNILGTRALADLSVKYQVRKFVMISTDKAVNPTNVMGCSKRIAEIYVRSLNEHMEKMGMGRTSFVTTRFGNVLGSNGSVIPIFRKQIEEGGPVTVTHPEITRYFMTIPEACQLVIEAGIMGNGGEIFIFDMGKPIRIYDLAKKMVMLSGKELGKDMDIVFTGLRDGEKLFEELLSNKENTIPTHHHKIMIARVQEYQYEEVERTLELLRDLIHDHNELKMVAVMKELVPEFRSNYSRFEVLDTEIN
ncbi:MAG: polysaccharide biosynthesis protein [Cyclobacteriaceae bacterium]|nr:polysaccharide biosynthesis protein [Cyclobacteriaceae bacterium]